MRKRQLGFLLVVMMFALVSCASFQIAKDQPYDTWSNKKKLTNAINTYSTEYDKYMAAAIRTDLTEAQKMYLKNKRLALVGLDKVIVLLIPLVDSGEGWPLELEYQLMDWLTQLGFQPM